MSVNGDTQRSLKKGKEHFQTMRIPEVQIKTNKNQLHLQSKCNHCRD